VPREMVRFAKALNGKWTGSWSTVATRACKDSASMSLTSTPSQHTVPSLASYSPAISREQVLFPEPLTPTKATVSPARSVIEMPLRAGISLPG